MAWLASSLAVICASLGFWPQSGVLGNVFVEDDYNGPFLFDLEKDPGESTNLIYDSAYAEILDELNSRMSLYSEEAAQIAPDLEVSVVYSIWEEAGGAVPWSEELSEDVDTKESLVGNALSVAPSIVFILLDDVGLNDVSFHYDEGSSWVDFATPTLKAMASEGVVLANYYVAWQCNPTRAALLTGRYSFRLGFSEVPGSKTNLPLPESTIAEELKNYGYRTALVGKWHMGFQSWAYTPTHRGFDYFYGYYGSHVDYWSKLGFTGQFSYEFDLHDQASVVTDGDELDEHLSLLLGRKATEVIRGHAGEYPENPLFLYYAMINVHSGTSGLRPSSVDGLGMDAPEEYKELCALGHGLNATEYDQHIGYCALLVMLDEAVADVLCALEESGMSDNTLVVVSSDNGAWGPFPESSTGLRGHKANLTEGGVHAPALLWGPPALIPPAVRGRPYSGLVHVTDWLPTFMRLASGGGWNGPKSGFEVDGLDLWDAIIHPDRDQSPRTEIVHNINLGSGKIIPATSSIQIGMVKLIVGSVNGYSTPVVSMEKGGDFSSCIAFDSARAPQQVNGGVASEGQSSVRRARSGSLRENNRGG